MSDWPPPGFIRDPATGEQRRATVAEEREANRLLWKHRDLSGVARRVELKPEPARVTPPHVQLGLDGLGTPS